ncbi:MAG TPA: acyl-CoA dehydrogenase family protein [Symbiobacteriaceae bacterium]|nr:acyl-CoA dehydrogenase family protein [Symbiobacteriaceae bacterium]
MGHFIFNDTHDTLRAEIRRYVERELAPHAEAWEEAEYFPDSVFWEMGRLGYLGLRYPEEYGGSGLDYYSAIVLAEEMSRALNGGIGMAVAVHTEMATPPILKFGTEEQKKRFLVPAIKGKKIAALAITEPGAGSDVSGIRTRAVRDGNDWVINGSKIYITNGMRADFYVVVTRTSDDQWGGLTLFLVEKNAPGFSVGRKLKKLGMHSSDTAELFFENVRVPDANRLGDEGQGFYNIMWELQGERLIGAAAAVAGAERSLEMAMAYADQREAFGRKIGKFQVIRHKLAQMATEIEAAKSLVYTCAWRWEQGDYAVKEISMAKLFASEVACRVADEALQIHGGAGYMMEYPVQRAWRDARLLRIGAGTDEIMREIIAKQMGF